MRIPAFSLLLALALLRCGGVTGRSECAGSACHDTAVSIDGSADPVPCPSLPCPSDTKWDELSCSCEEPDCRGVGIYEAGKEGSYRPCCAGLNTVQEFKPASRGDALEHVCAPPIGVNRYACVEGSCGDGRCEAPEAEPCACELDCPSAAWGPVVN